MLHDDDGRFFKLLRQLPASVQIHEVVKAQLLALQLLRSRNPQTASVCVKRRALMRILAVTQRLRQRQVDPQRGWQFRVAYRCRSIGRRSFCNPFERASDGRIVSRGQCESLFGQPPPCCPAQRPPNGLQLITSAPRNPLGASQSPHLQNSWPQIAPSTGPRYRCFRSGAQTLLPAVPRSSQTRRGSPPPCR